MNAILLSAGFGTRFRPYTNFTAKPTIPFLNLPLIAYSMYYANKWGCKELTINTHYLPNTIEDCVNKLSNNISCKINFLNESPDILDSGGGIKNAESSLNNHDNFLVFNTDIPHILPNVNFEQIQLQHNDSGSLVTFLTCDIENIGTSIKGLWTKNNSNQVVDIGLGPKENLFCRHYSGIMLISKKLLELQPQGKPHNIIYDLILPAINNGHKVSTYHIDNLKWFETGNLNSYLDGSFEAGNEFCRNPDSPFSSELNRIFMNFKTVNKVINNENYNLIYKNKLPIGLDTTKLSGSIVLGEGINIDSLTSVSNSVISSNDSLNTDNCSRQLFL